MKNTIIILLLGFTYTAHGQSYPHYTMFMFNKLIYNPGYAGNKDLTTVNAYYRNQWTGINGAPKTMSVTVDGPVGSYMKPFRHVALGLGISNESLGVVSNTNINAYYAYRILLGKTVLSLGLQAGVSLYNARYSDLNPYQQNDQALTQNIKNAVLPNFGPGIYWSGSNFYVGAGIPGLLENYYDKDHQVNNEQSRQLRSYYLGGGYVFSLSENVKLEPQVFGRYAGNDNYNLPFNADMNVSFILYDRLLLGATYRTDRSMEGIIHFQALKNINIGYSYDYTISALNGYNSGSHEITLGFDFIKDHNKYVNPRFVKSF